MIVVLFPAGGFGSTIEYCLRQFSNELTKIEASVMENGSLHSYKKEFHPVTVQEFLKNKDIAFEIATPTYPGLDYSTPLETVNLLLNKIKSDDKVILINFDTIDMAERNQLFSYHKIPNFIDFVLKDKYINWDPEYKSFNDLKVYEIREALSFYIDRQKDYLEVSRNKIKNCMYVTPNDILFDFKNTILKIIKYCNLTIDESKNINDFYKIWFSKQQYILNEFEIVNRVIDKITSGEYFSWEPISMVGEAIIQSRLRQNGIEIACFNLDIFPTNTTDLQKVII